jgi:hypothetical protein
VLRTDRGRRLPIGGNPSKAAALKEVGSGKGGRLQLPTGGKSKAVANHQGRHCGGDCYSNARSSPIRAAPSTRGTSCKPRNTRRDGTRSLKRSRPSATRWWRSCVSIPPVRRCGRGRTRAAGSTSCATNARSSQNGAFGLFGDAALRFGRFLNFRPVGLNPESVPNNHCKRILSVLAAIDAYQRRR